MLVDINLLLYASIASFAQHEAARDWLDRQLSGVGRVGLPWVTLIGYLRIATNPRLFLPQISMATGWSRISAWLSADPVWIPQPTQRHSEVLETLLAEPGVHGNLVPDAHLAALAIEHGLTLCSTDGDFARFRDLRWLNPLARRS
jgi:toxin-antitoxin system PIN domain toxin